jgi:subtilisin family serine protease
MLKTCFASLSFLLSTCCLSQSDPSLALVPVSIYQDGFIHIQMADGHLLKRDKITLSADLVDYPELSQLFAQDKIIWIEQEFKVLAKRNQAIARIYRLKYSQSVQPLELIKQLEQLHYISYAERIPQFTTNLIPNDPDYADGNKRWHLDQISATNAWNSSTGCPNVRIAIVDDAVLLSHEDLQANIFVNPTEIPNNGIDDDGNGYIDDVNGFDVADNDNNANPPSTATNSSFTHGTHVAGIAGAVSDNNIGTASIGFNSSIVPIKTAKNNTADPSLLYNPMHGVEYAIALGVDVINMSWGSYAFSYTNQAVFSQAHSDGIVCVGAAGNDYLNSIIYPAGYDNVISVGATDPANEHTTFSNYSTFNHVYAPGLNIWSTLAGGNSSYGYLSGTSMSSPLVAGLAGLMICNDPTLTPFDVKACLRSSADIYFSNLSSQDLFVINAENTLLCAPPLVYNCEPYNCNLIKNGDFESPDNSSITNYGTASGVANGLLCSWQTYAGTSDVLPSTPIGNDQFVSGFTFRPFPNLAPSTEGFVSNRLEMIAGYQYRLEFDYAIAQLLYSGDVITNELDSLMIGLVDNQYIIPNTTGINIDTLRLANYTDIPVDYIPTNWLALANTHPTTFNHHLILDFIAPADTSKQRLFMHPSEWDTLAKVHLIVDNVSVKPIIQFSITSTETDIVAGGCVTLTAAGQATSFVWEPFNLFTNPVGSSQLVCLDSTTTFFVTAYDSTVNCSSTDSITINVGKLGLDDEGFDELNVFPNPASDLISIQLPAGIVKPQKLIIYSNTGKAVCTYALTSSSGPLEIDIKHLAAGAYIIKIDGNWATTLIKK